MFKNFIKKLKIHYGLYGAILTAVCAILIFVDLLTKFLEEKYAWKFWHDVKAINWLIYVESGHRNDGAAFSSFAGNQTFLIIITVLMLAALIVTFLLTPNRFQILKIAIVMIISGAIGNLVDRIMFQEVRDFVWINIFGNFACCNFADFWIVLGAILAAVDIMFLNELALIPLTKKAKEAQKKEREKDLNNSENGTEE
ncbi:MAG: signal peptidase II [Clostridia bacterium]|nr:signal peptidase II [Clostridia bacterium]